MLAPGAEDTFYDTGHLLVTALRHGLPEVPVTADDARAKARQIRAGFVSGRVPPVPLADDDDQIRVPGMWPRVRVPADIRELSERVTALLREKEAAVDAGEYGRAAEIRDREKELVKARQELVTEWSGRVDVLAVVEEVEALRAEVDRLRNL